MNNLTPRQLTVVNCLCDGLTIDQTADKLCISRSTVEKVLRDVKRRLNAKTLAHVVSIALRKGLICVLIASSILGVMDVQRLRNRTGRRELTEVIQQGPEIV
jgi:DNA-binding CsgD family transcriptional regulator